MLPAAKKFTFCPMCWDVRGSRLILMKPLVWYAETRARIAASSMPPGCGSMSSAPQLTAAHAKIAKIARAKGLHACISVATLRTALSFRALIEMDHLVFVHDE